MCSCRFLDRRAFLIFFGLLAVLYLLYRTTDVFPYLLHRTKGAIPPILHQSLTEIHRNGCKHVPPSYLSNYGRKNVFPNGIPRLLHLTYKTEDIPVEYFDLIENCVRMNDDMKTILWTDDSSHRFVKEYFPNLLRIYESFLSKKSEKLKRSDIVRNMILYQFGGIYMDMDTKCQRPFRTRMTGHSCILSTDVKERANIKYNMEFVVMNSLMACVPRHSFFGLMTFNQTEENFSDILSSTGPFLMTDRYIAYIDGLRKSESTNPRSGVFLAPSEWFSPYLGSDYTFRCVFLIGKWRREGCRTYSSYIRREQSLIENATVVHMFYHFGYSAGERFIQRSQHICEMASQIYVPQFP